jgi:hypothetical protein
MVLNKIKENLEMKMKYYLIYILPFVFASVLLTGCADLQTDIAQPESLTFHGPGINNPNSPNFHGNLVREVKWNMRDNCETVMEQISAAAIQVPTAEAVILQNADQKHAIPVMEYSLIRHV